MVSGYPLRSVLPIVLIAMAIATMLPFDKGLHAITAGHTAPHVLLVGAMAVAGGWLAPRAGLKLGGGWQVGLAAAFAMAAYVVLLDVVLFRPMVKVALVSLSHMNLLGRLIVFMARAFNENVIYRLFAFAALMAGLRRVYQAREVPLAMVLLAGLLAQLVNIALNVVLAADHTPGLAELAYWSVRFVLPGVVWAWLYWRHGFLTAECASVGAHLFLQPAYGLLL